MEEPNQNVLFVMKTENGESINVEVCASDTLKILKERILNQVGIPVDINQLQIDGKILDDDTNLLDYFTGGPDDVAEKAFGDVVEDEGGQEYILPQTPTMVEDIKPEIMAAGLFCAAAGCTNNKFDTPEIPLFKLPAQKRRCHQWLCAANRMDLLHQTLGYLTHHIAICQKHFTKNQFASKDCRSLKANAMPTLFDGIEGIEIDEIDFEDMPVIEVDSLPHGLLTVTGIRSEETDEMEPEHPGSLCRLCACPLEGSSSVFIYGEDGETRCLAEKINSSLPVSVRKTDPLPKQICIGCTTRLESSHKFAEACIKAEIKLKNLTRNFLVHQLKNKPQRMKSEKKYCCPLCCKGAMSFLGNNEENLSENVVCLKKSTVDDDALALPTGLLPISKFEPEDASHDFINELYSDEEDEGSEGEMEKEDPLSEAPVMDFSGSLYLQEDRNDMSYSCDICEEHFQASFECLEHCKLHYTSNGCPCIVCGLVFSTEIELKEHFGEHKNKVSALRRSQCKPLLECGACKTKFSTRKDFILHKCSKPILIMMPNDLNDLYCQTCDKYFKSSERAAQHRSYHAGAAKLMCVLCQGEFETEQALSYHVLYQHEDSDLPSCHVCALRFYSIDCRDKHEKIHNQPDTYQCSLCSKTFRDLETVTAHIEGHATQTTAAGSIAGSSGAAGSSGFNLQCFKCDLQFSKKSHYAHHLENAHDGDLNNVRRMPSLIQYQCKMCSERFTSSQDVIIHRTVHWKSCDPNMPHVCEYCGEAHASPNALARHRRILHPDEHPYVCTLCENKSRTLYEARVHRKAHTGYVTVPQKPQSKTYQCDQCPSLFSDKASFLSHKKSHKLSKGFECEFCKKVFPERHRLVVHRRQHTGEKPFSCGVCGKMFAQTSAMYTHALLHTGETPHSCDLCGRKFRIKSDRDNHRRTHTGEKPYKCNYCGKNFRTGQVYYQHRMIHTGERRFPCDVCGRAFKRSHTLVCHRRIHTGEKPNICDICGKGFRQRTDMRKHKMNLHGVPA